MKKFLSVVLAMFLIFALVGCNDVDDLSSQNSSLVSSVIEQTDTTTSQVESEQETSSQVEDIPSQQPSSEVSSNVSQNSTPVTTPSVENESVVETLQEEINFVPNKLLGKLVLSNKVLYNGTRYAYSNGKNNGVDCDAIITVDENGEYLRCVTLLNTNDNERGIFTVCNGRIYYLKYVLNDPRDYKLLQSVQIWSMNLSGGDKRQEKEISSSFTQIYSVNAIANSKYMILALYNDFDFTYTYYRYDVTTKEAVKVTTPEFDEGFYIHSNQLFCCNNLKLYKYDINFNNKQLLYDLSQISSDYVIIDLVQDGFMITVKSTNSKYFLDLNGNITKK